MATTTYEIMRGEQIAQVRAISPCLLRDVRFLPHLEEQDFREWAEENAHAAFRRFSVLDLFEYEPIETSNSDVEWTIGRNEVVIAYPRDFRYGGENLRDLNDAIRSDERLLETAIGARGHANFTDATAIRESYTIEDGDAIRFAVLVYRFHFWRDVTNVC